MSASVELEDAGAARFINLKGASRGSEERRSTDFGCSRDSRRRQRGLLCRSKVGEEGGLSSSTSTWRRLRRRLSENSPYVGISSSSNSPLGKMGTYSTPPVEGWSGSEVLPLDMVRAGGESIGIGRIACPYIKEHEGNPAVPFRFHCALMTVDVSGKLDATVNNFLCPSHHYPFFRKISSLSFS